MFFFTGKKLIVEDVITGCNSHIQLFSLFFIWKKRSSRNDRHERQIRDEHCVIC
jgi:hypothetical protein